MEVSTEGDSFFVVFVDAMAALRAAADIQRDLATHAWPDGHEFRVRIGVHTGQAVVAGDDYVGLDVNRAARIANAANGGQTIVSDAARSAAESSLPAGHSLRDLGRHRLRDVGVEHLWQLEVPGLP
jgi:class 3 adenylate cyclase